MTLDRKQIAESWTYRGLRCELWTDPPGQRWESFTHATDEVVIVLEGEMEFEVEGTVQHPKPGKQLILPAGAVHSARNIGHSTARWLCGFRGQS
jgi:quercetin dioxygenase-like cupin family protein